MRQSVPRQQVFRLYRVNTQSDPIDPTLKPSVPDFCDILTSSEMSHKRRTKGKSIATEMKKYYIESPECDLEQIKQSVYTLVIDSRRSPIAYSISAHSKKISRTRDLFLFPTIGRIVTFEASLTGRHTQSFRIALLSNKF
jgi:hypothetical protein